MTDPEWMRKNPEDPTANSASSNPEFGSSGYDAPNSGATYGAPGTGPAPGYGQQPPAYGQPDYSQPGYGQQPPAYGQPPAYAAQPAYGGYGGQPGYNPNDPDAPFGRNPQTGEPYSDKQKLTAGLLGILLGAFGAGRFYLNQPGIAIAQIAVTWLTCGIGGIWPLIDGIMMLTGSVKDQYGRPLRD